MARLPKSQWPQKWIHDGMVDLVVPLVLALYGHPKSGKFWEDYVDEHLIEKGWKPIPERKSCYWHEELECSLVLYVDDLNIAGPPKSFPISWANIWEKIKLGKIGPVDHFLETRVWLGLMPQTDVDVSMVVSSIMRTS